MFVCVNSFKHDFLNPSPFRSNSIRTIFHSLQYNNKCHLADHWASEYYKIYPSLLCGKNHFILLICDRFIKNIFSKSRLSIFLFWKCLHYVNVIVNYRINISRNFCKVIITTCASGGRMKNQFGCN